MESKDMMSQNVSPRTELTDGDLLLMQCKLLGTKLSIPWALRAIGLNSDHFKENEVSASLDRIQRCITCNTWLMESEFYPQDAGACGDCALEDK